MTTPPGYAGSNTDTSGVSGNSGPASRGTQDRSSNQETATPAGYGGDPDTGLAPDPNTAVTGTPDTSGTNASNGPYTPTPPPLLSGTVDTQLLGWPQTPGVTQAYRAPTQGVGYINGTGAADTTWTDRPISDGSVRTDYVQNMTGTQDSYTIGANGANGPGTSSLVPVAPSGTPTVATGPRSVTVTWATVADPDPTAPVLGYVILGSTGGTTFVGDGNTSVVVTNLVPGQLYKFQVAARNKNGTGPYGTISATVTPYNPDEADVNKPGGLDPYWKQNPIYNADGTIKSGSGTSGKPGAPTSVVLSGTTTPGVVNVAWTAPASGGTILSYTVTLSSGQTKSIPTGTTTAQFTGVTSATAITATVTSEGAVMDATSTASAAFGKPTAPAAPTITSPSTGTVHCVWTAPSSGAPLNYIVTLSNAHTHTVAGNVLTYDFTGETTGASVTATVGAQGSVSTTTSAASSSVTVA
jgi:hypothetical protein